jgi:osmotically-inducible protein OsmY
MVSARYGNLFSTSEDAMRTDSETRKDVEDELRWDPDIDAEIARDAAETLRSELPYSSQFVKVTAKEGWLTLKGALEWNYQRERAEKAVRGVRGAIGVTNDVVLKPRVAASDVKSKIEDAWKRRAELDAEGITVEAIGSKATLRGSVRSWADRTEAERAA